MDSKDQNLELINEAIKRLLEEKKNKKASNGESFFQGDDDKDEDHLLLSRLLSQLESVKRDNGALQKPEALTELGEVTASANGEIKPKRESGGKPDGDRSSTKIDKEEILKELNKVKKQNTITHWLLSIMIVLTVAWQASEVTVFLKLKHGLSNPLRCIGEMITWRGDSSEEHQKEASPSPSLPSLKMPEFPHMEMQLR